MPEPARPELSVLVTTYNEEDNIAACLDSLSWGDQILVVDSFSDDRTPEIVRGYESVELLQRTYYGAAAQKNWAMERCRGEWILIFDADERCTPELRREIEELLESGPRHNAYTIRRRCFFLGKPIRYSGWQRDQVVRLVRKGTASYPNRRVHADMITDGPAPLLRNRMDHYMVEDFHDYLHRMVKYARWGAAQGWRDGRSSGPLEVFGRPLWRFVRTYFFQRGILDGLMGLVFCLLQSFTTYMKWSLLWSWRVDEARGVEPDLPEFDDDEDRWKRAEELGSAS